MKIGRRHKPLAEGVFYERVEFVIGLIPGLLLSLLIAIAAFFLQTAEVGLFGRAWLEALVLAIVLGTAIRTAWSPGSWWLPGIAFSAKILLEIAVALLGASVSASTILGAGVALLLGSVATVAVALTVSYGLGRLFALSNRMAILIACGNSICGNSAIAAVAPVIGADSDDVAASIAFTAVLGVALVLGLPLLGLLLHLSPRGLGILTGLTVYAVPQVLAVTAPIGSISTQIGTLVKLARVLMLGPIVLGLALLFNKRNGIGTVSTSYSAPRLPKIHHLVPWFIIGFLGLAVARSTNLIPAGLLTPVGRVAASLPILSMAALGLGVDVRVVSRAGPRVAAVVTLSLLALGAVAIVLILSLGIA